MANGEIVTDAENAGNGASMATDGNVAIGENMANIENVE